MMLALTMETTMIEDHKAHALKLLGGDLRTAIRGYLTQLTPENAIQRVVTLLARVLEDEATATGNPEWQQAATRARELLVDDAAQRLARDQVDDAERGFERLRGER
jgi:hypothetical protein